MLENFLLVFFPNNTLSNTVQSINQRYIVINFIVTKLRTCFTVASITRLTSSEKK